MKKILIPLTLSLMCGAAASAQCQHPAGKCAAAAADTVKICESVDGDYHVCRYEIRRTCDSGFDVRYRINLSEVNTAFDNNAHELDALWNLISRVQQEKGAQLKEVRIVGYASPDGNTAANRRLAERRADDFKTYLQSRSCARQCCDVAMSGVASDWKSCCPLIDRSSVPDKEKVIAILSSDCSEAQKECALKRIPAAWNYIKDHILPAQRRVDVEVLFTVTDEAVQRTLMHKPAPEPAVQTPAPSPEEVTEQVVVVEEPLSKKEQRRLRREAKREAREAKRIARREAKDARRMAKDAERMVRDAQ